MPHSSSSRAYLVSLVLCLTSACSDEIVYRDRPVFSEPPTGAAGFLGFSSPDTKRTTCGNCHVGKQAVWAGTAHAGAWESLVGSGAQAASCEPCHAVSYKGNVATDTTAGWVATRSPRYQGVQCESCHGPGLTHVTNPDVAANKPLASVAVGPTLTNGCGECHSGAHQPFVEQWAASRHGRVSESRATNIDCKGCHGTRGALETWGIKTNFTELTQAGPYMGITCAVCHDPHDARNEHQLRFPVNVASLQSNLCMKCHYRRAAPLEASSSGPHSPQGPVLLGEAGWIPPNFEYPPKSLVGSHGSDRNPELCATCHVNSYTINDKLTGKFAFRATGHSFQAIPCVDAQGIPIGPSSTVCEDSTRSFKACVGCHLSETAARTARAVARLRLSRLADQLDTLLKLVPKSEFSTTDSKITTAEGARFNMQLGDPRIRSGFSNQPGSAIHNPFLVEALMLASIKQIQIDYGLTIGASLSLQQELTPPPSLRGK